MIKKGKAVEKADKIGLWIPISIGISILLFMGAVFGTEIVDIRLNQETADDICQQLTNESTAVASNEVRKALGDGKLICTIPSFDSTQNIIVRGNDK